MARKGFTTQALHSDRKSQPEHGVLHSPVHNSVAFSYDDAHDLAAVFQNRRSGYAYGRQSNPTVDALGRKITEMEEGIGSVLFSTGMAAIGSTLLALLRAGDHIVSSAFLFGNTNSLFSTLAQFGVEVSFVDATDAANVENAIQDNTRLVFVETIANPVTQVVDLEAIGALCKSRGILYCVDNTMTTPYLFVAKSVSADLVINALTKNFGGHGNALGGSVTDTGLYDWSNFPNIHDTYRARPPAQWGLLQIRKKGLRDFGATLSPEAAHHLSVGSDTLSLRLDRACANALAIARFCQQHPRVQRTSYPGLPEHPQHERASKLFNGQYGAILSIELADDLDCFDFLNALQVIVTSSNLGDNRSLGIPVAHTIYYEMGPEKRASMGVGDTMIRLSIGIEEESDLLADLEQALSV